MPAEHLDVESSPLCRLACLIFSHLAFATSFVALSLFLFFIIGFLFSFHFALLITPFRVSRTERSGYILTVIQLLLKFSQPTVSVYIPRLHVKRQPRHFTFGVLRVGSQRHVRTSTLFLTCILMGLFTLGEARTDQ